MKFSSSWRFLCIKLAARIISSNALWGCCDEIRLSVEFLTVGFVSICRHSCCYWFPGIRGWCPGVLMRLRLKGALRLFKTCQLELRPVLLGSPSTVVTRQFIRLSVTTTTILHFSLHHLFFWHVTQAYINVMTTRGCIICFVYLEFPVYNELWWREVVLEIVLERSHHLSSLNNTEYASLMFKSVILERSNSDQ